MKEKNLWYLKHFFLVKKKTVKINIFIWWEDTIANSSTEDVSFSFPCSLYRRTCKYTEFSCICIQKGILFCVVQCSRRRSWVEIILKLFFFFVLICFFFFSNICLRTGAGWRGYGNNTYRYIHVKIKAAKLATRRREAQLWKSQLFTETCRNNSNQ